MHLLKQRNLGAFFLVLVANSAFAGSEVNVSDLPVEVKSAIDGRFPGARYLKAELDRKDHGEEYEVDICVENKKREVEVSPQGTILDIEEKGGC